MGILKLLDLIVAARVQKKLPNGCQQFKLVIQTVSGNRLQYFQSRHKNGFNSQCKKPEEDSLNCLENKDTAKGLK